MEQSNNIDSAKLKKVVAGLFAAENAVEEFDCSLYTNDELNFIMREMEKQTQDEIIELLKIAEECEENEITD
jgi:hypothetical protein